MASFGVPQINLRWGGDPGKPIHVGKIALNQVGIHYDAAFQVEEEAKKYEDGVLNQIHAPGRSR